MARTVRCFHTALSGRGTDLSDLGSRGSEYTLARSSGSSWTAVMPSVVCTQRESVRLCSMLLANDKRIGPCLLIGG